MKVRACPSRLAKQIGRLNPNPQPVTRRGLCIQCRQGLGGQTGAARRAGNTVGAGLRAVPVYGSRIALPARFIAGQRRALATVQNSMLVIENSIANAN